MPPASPAAPPHSRSRVLGAASGNQASVTAAKGDALYTLHGWDYMVYAYLQMSDDAAADKVGAEARAFPLNDSGLGQVFGAAAIPCGC